MPGQQLEIFRQGAMPAHIAALNEEHRNIVVRATGNSLTFEGKIWAITIDGKKTKLMKTGDDGEEQPVQVFNCVLLGYNPFRGRMYYAGNYDPKKPKIPDCWSDDSVKPNADVPHKQAKTCAECKMSKKGSAITDDNKQTVACSQFQKLAVVPLAKLGEFPVLRLNIKITSIWDKDGEASHPNWFAFDQYMQALTAGGIRNTSVLPTRIKFDVNAAYPKLLFSPGKDYFDEETAKMTNQMAQSEEVKNLLAETFHPTATTGTAELPEDEAEAEGPAPARPAQAGPKANGTAKPAVDPDEDDGAAIAAVAAKGPVIDQEGEEVVMTVDQRAAQTRAANAAKTATTATAAVAKAGKAAAAKPAVVDEDDEEVQAAAALKRIQEKKAAAAKAAAAPAADEGEPPARPSKAAAAAAAGKTAPAATPVAAPSNVAALMQDWDA